MTIKFRALIIGGLFLLSFCNKDQTGFLDGKFIPAAPPPLQISPTTPTVVAGGTLSFSAVDGSPPYTYKILFGSGSIDATSGAYTAPASAGTDVVQVTDKLKSTSAALVTITAAAARFITVGDGGTVAYTADDGASWQTKCVNGSASPCALGFNLLDICLNNDTGSGNEGRILTVGSAGAVYYSDDGGDTFTSSSPNAGLTYEAAAFGGGRYVIIGGTTAYYSTDGINFTAATTNPAHAIKKVNYGSGRFVAVSDERVYVSNDGGVNWSFTQHLNCLSGAGNCPTRLKDVLFGTNRYVTVGKAGSTDATSYHSSNGSAWAAAQGILNQASGELLGLAYNSSQGANGRFVGVGLTGDIFYTDDEASNWVNVSSGANDRYDVVYANSRFIAVGAGGEAFTSSDGTTWANTTTNPGGGNIFRAVLYRP